MGGARAWTSLGEAHAHANPLANCPACGTIVLSAVKSGNELAKETQGMTLLFDKHDLPKKKKRKSPDGVSTNDLVVSAYVGTNDILFPQILKLFVAKGSTVADVTWGKGVFWKNVPPKAYKLLATDLSGGVDARKLPYQDGEIDCVVFDPPYMHTPGGTAHVNHQNYEGYYRNNVASS